MDSLLANRYRVKAQIGQGGAGAVYHVTDEVRGADLALKQLHVSADSRGYAKLAEGFEHEFHTLARLKHPRICSVYDYGVAPSGPYYTMELLPGSDLRSEIPFPWRQACSIMRDVASALALLHSRRLIHRDVTDRNIRRTSDGKAKLIDFGAMAPMGRPETVIGTPPFMAPEVVLRQMCDGRVDIFAMGAVLYFLLSGRHAYPARRIDQLNAAWQADVPWPSVFTPDVPKALEQLVMSMVALDPLGRPASAGEVMERLGVAAGLAEEEELSASGAYLITPTLVGRAAPLLRVRRALVRAGRGRGSAVVVCGARGVGRSRFVDECALQAKLAGALVLRADAGELPDAPWTAACSLIEQLVDATEGTGRAPGVGDEGEALERLSSLASVRDAELLRQQEPESLRTRLLDVLLEWIRELATSRPLFVALDDAHLLDEPSLALAAGITRTLGTSQVVMLASVRTEGHGEADRKLVTPPGAAGAALELLQSRAKFLELDALSVDETEQLLQSVFGQAPNVKLVAHRAYQASKGNAALIMELAQQLIDIGAARYDAGGWLLPAHLDEDIFAAGAEGAFSRRLASLSETARRLSAVRALCPDASLSRREFTALIGETDSAKVFRALDELVASGVFARRGDEYVLVRSVWIPAIVSELDEQHKRDLHRRIADVLSETAAGDPLTAAWHWLFAGDTQKAGPIIVRELDELFRPGQSQSEQRANLERIMSDQFFENVRVAADTLADVGGLRDRCLLELALVHTARFGRLAELKRRLPSVLAQLSLDSGLTDYHSPELAELAPDQRLMQALGAAQARYEASAPQARAFDPREAIARLCRVILDAAGCSGHTFDYDLVESLPSLEPLTPLSPSIGIAHALWQAVHHTNAGRFPQARALFDEILERLDAQAEGLDPTQAKVTRYGVTYGLANITAVWGVPGTLECADKLDEEPAHQVNAQLVRTIYYLTQGDTRRAQSCQRAAEDLQIRNAPAQYFGGTNLLPWLLTCAAADDLMGVKRVMRPVSDLAERFPPWVAISHFASAHYARIRGDQEAALACFERALEHSAPGRHCVWAYSAEWHVSVLVALGRHREAYELGHERLALCEREGLHMYRMRSELALAAAHLGCMDEAGELAERQVADWQQLGATGIHLGNACEARARVALLARDDTAYKVWAERCAAELKRGASPAFAVKYERLCQDARKLDLAVWTTTSQFDESTQASVSDGGTEQLLECTTQAERSECALHIILAQMKATEGHLFVLREEDRLVPIASRGAQLPEDLVMLAYDYLQSEAELDQATVSLSAPSQALTAWTLADGRRFTPVLVQHVNDNGELCIVGVAAVMAKANAALASPTWTVINSVSRHLQDLLQVTPRVVAA